MWDSVIIGTGSRGNSAARVFQVIGNDKISENQVSYWISDVYLEMGMTIMKDTEEGKHLTELIHGGVHFDSIMGTLRAMFLKRVSSVRLSDAIDSAIDQAFQQGRKAKAEEMRRVLGV